MAEKDQNNQSIELDELAKDNQELKNDVTAGQKYLMWVIIALSVIAVAVIIYIFAFRQPGVKASNEAIAQADIEMTQGNDSVALAKYQQVADEYGSYDAGSRAALMAASINYKNGNYEAALADLKNFDAKESIVGAAAMSLKGDCYVNLNNYKDAIAAYDKAISESGDNALYTPLFMMKKATVLREQKDYAAELKVLQSIKTDYPQYAATYRLDIDKYIARAEYQASK